MITISNLNKSYKTKVLDSVSFELKEGSICGLFGVNGAGKSTLLKTMCGLEIPDSGEILFNGKPFIVGKFPRIGAMIEYPAFYSGISGYGNLKLLADLSGQCKKKDIINALKTVGLYEKRNVNVKKYSLGMKQRLYFASVIMRDVDLLILDEPFNGIDPIVLNTFEILIKSLAKQGKTIIVSSHEIRELQALVDKAIFIDKGKIIYTNENAESIDIFKEFLARVNSTGEAQ